MRRIIALAVAAALATAPAIALAQSAPSAGGFQGNPFAQIGQHQTYGGNPPAISSGCGTGATFAGTDTAGHVNLGTSTSQPCTVTFSQPFVNRPTCIVTAEGFTPSYSTSASSLAITALVDSGRVNFTCFARAGG